MKLMNSIYVISALAAIYLLVSKVKKKGVIDVVNVLPRGSKGNWPLRSEFGITDYTVHHSATDPSGDNLSDIKAFARHHINKWGYGIAYATVIAPDGTRYKTNNNNSKTYHNGFNNTKAIGVCLIGNFEKYPPTPAQLVALDLDIKEKKKELSGLRYLNGHYDYEGSTRCPGFHMRGENGIYKLQDKHNLPSRPNIYNSRFGGHSGLVWGGNGKDENETGTQYADN